MVYWVICMIYEYPENFLTILVILKNPSKFSQD